MIIVLGAVEAAAIAWWLLSYGPGISGRYAIAVCVWLALIAVWTGGVVRIAKTGFLKRHTRLLSNLAGYSIVIAGTALFFGSFGFLRDGAISAAIRIPDASLAGIHILRLLAVGAFIKYRHGELPLHFVLIGALPDLLFGVSATAVTYLATSSALDAGFLVVWHCIGVAIFFGAGISMFFSVPSPMRIFWDSKPDTGIVFQFPMALAPNLTVPLFTIAHGLALVKYLVELL